MKKILKIYDVGKYIFFKNKKIRTPASLKVTESELKQLLVSFKMSDIQNYDIFLDNKPKAEVEVQIYENKNVIIEELDLEDTEPSSILEELIRNGEK